MGARAERQTRVRLIFVCPLGSKTVSRCLTRLYHSVAQLIRWADQVMLQGAAPNNKESTANVTTVIRTVLDNVKVRKIN